MISDYYSSHCPQPSQLSSRLGPSNFEQGFCSKVPLRVKGGELELPSEKEIDALDKNNDCCQDA